MKKLLSIALFALLINSSVSYAQSNLTWVIKDQMQKGAIKTMTVFNSSVTGFKSAEEVNKFCQTLKSYPEVASCTVVSSTASSCSFKLAMKNAQNKAFYLGMAGRSGVAFISINGAVKSLDEMKRGKK
jgi:DNA integrity scanning protein DisA with diadenylate cyclase activity